MTDNSTKRASHAVIFTDLDGTLLSDRTYDFTPALPALDQIRSLMIPLILVSSKTKAEIEFYCKGLSVEEPFIAENGGAIYFPSAFPLPDIYSYERADNYRALFIGRPLCELSERINTLRDQFHFRCFSEMTMEEIAAVTGLTLQQAGLASQREFDEPIVLESASDDGSLICEKALEIGLDCVKGGRFLHVFLGGDKGKAVEVLLELYRQKGHEVLSIGLGDSQNDVSMLRAVDKAVVMQSPDGTYIEGLDHPDLVKAEGRGPSAWNKVVLSILEDLFLWSDMGLDKK